MQRKIVKVRRARHAGNAWKGSSESRGHRYSGELKQIVSQFRMNKHMDVAFLNPSTLQAVLDPMTPTVPALTTTCLTLVEFNNSRHYSIIYTDQIHI